MSDTGVVGAAVRTGARVPLGNGHLLLWQHLIQRIVKARVLLFDAAHDAAHHGGLHLALSADILVEGEADGGSNALSGTRQKKDWQHGCVGGGSLLEQP